MNFYIQTEQGESLIKASLKYGGGDREGVITRCGELFHSLKMLSEDSLGRVESGSLLINLKGFYLLVTGC